MMKGIAPHGFPIRLSCAVALSLICVAPSALASSFPSRPVTLIVPHRTGGPSDMIARVMSKMLSHALRQPLIIENRPGAGGNIAGEQAAQAPADGYTLLLGDTGILVTNPVRQKNIGFDPLLDFQPITLLGTQANVLVVNPGVPALTLTQLVEHARGRPGMLTYASSGYGSASHLAGELFKTEARVSLVHVPYKKPGPALQDVIAGHVLMMFAPSALVASHVRAGRLRALAVASAQRSSTLPGVPTIDEIAYPGFDATTWYGLVAPAGTPRQAIDVLHHTTSVVLEDPLARKVLGGLGIDAVGSSPKEFDAYIKAQIPKWRAVARAVGDRAN
jgi:tripartite-type tricarboxylate transporter receptor subunit TctC